MTVMPKGRHARPVQPNSTKRIAVGATFLLGGSIVSVAFAGSASAAVLTPAQVAAVAKQGCPQLNPAQLNLAVKIAGAESGLNTDANAAGSEDSRGLWQINAGVHGSPWGNLYDPVTNARAMCDLSSGGNDWSPWSAYTNGSYANKDGFTGSVTAPAPVKPPPPPSPLQTGSTPPPAAAKPVGPTSVGVSTHHVVAGDTLYRIAVDHGVKGGWQPLYENNKQVIGANPNLIKPGQVLHMPGTGSVVVPPKPTTPPTVSGHVMPVKGTLGDGLIVGSGGSMSRSAGGHSGLDIVAPQGTPVLAATAGKVVAVNGGAGAAYGNYVALEHSGGIYTLYAHLSASSVQVGESVTAGQKIGNVGSTGNSSGPHLHFEVRTDPTAFSSGIFLNPAIWLRSHGVTV